MDLQELKQIRNLALIITVFAGLASFFADSLSVAKWMSGNNEKENTKSYYSDVHKKSGTETSSTISAFDIIQIDIRENDTLYIGCFEKNTNEYQSKVSLEFYSQIRKKIISNSVKIEQFYDFFNNPSENENKVALWVEFEILDTLSNDSLSTANLSGLLTAIVECKVFFRVHNSSRQEVFSSIIEGIGYSMKEAKLNSYSKFVKHNL